jgi:uncharacterized protein YggE
MHKFIAVLAISAALALPAPVLAEPVVATLTVTGQGSASTAPDIGTIRAGVETSGKTAAAALAANNALAGQLIATLKDAGVAPRDIQTGSLYVEPSYNRVSGTQPDQTPEVIGYRVLNEVSVTIRALGDMGAILDAVVQSGANRINSIGFGLSDDQAVTDEARREAMADAKRIAALYAEAAGVKLARILSISEGGSIQPRPGGGMMLRAEASSVPIEAGESTVQASVTIVWEIAPAGE